MRGTNSKHKENLLKNHNCGAERGCNGTEKLKLLKRCIHRSYYIYMPNFSLLAKFERKIGKEQLLFNVKKSSVLREIMSTIFGTIRVNLEPLCQTALRISYLSADVLLIFIFFLSNYRTEIVKEKKRIQKQKMKEQNHQ